MSVLSFHGISGLHCFRSSQFHDYPSLLASTGAVDRIAALAINAQWTKPYNAIHLYLSLLNSEDLEGYCMVGASTGSCTDSSHGLTLQSRLRRLSQI